MIKTAVMKLLTVKAAAVFALAAAGGVAVAATTGTLPTTLTGSEHSTSGVSAASSHHAGRPSARPSAGEKDKGRDGDKDGDQDGDKNGNQNGNNQDGDQNDNQNGNGPKGANGSPSPSLVGLCHAVNAGNKDDHGKALENPAFTALITAAGGKEKVDAFCVKLLAAASAASKEHPSHPADDPGNQNGKQNAGANP
jgi:hypothetical protein